MEPLFAAIRSHRLDEWDAWVERLVVWLAAICVGCVVVLFAKLMEWASQAFHTAYLAHDWIALVLTPIAGMAVVAATRRWFAGAEGSGIPQTIAALSAPPLPGRSSAFVSLRLAFAKIFFGTLVVGSGFSTGREGPSVQVGASIMHTFRHLLPARHRLRMPDLILAGGAAGIAAAFNTPLAGIVFSIEELAKRFEQRTNGVLLTAIVLSGLVSISLQGNYLYFGHLTVAPIDVHILLPLALCALVCGAAGGLTSWVLLLSVRPWPGLIGRVRQGSPVLFAGLCGLLVALLGLVTHGSIHGSGYEAAHAILDGHGGVGWYYAPAKLVATLASYFSGIPGGIFAPSLAIGAAIGRDLQPLLTQVATPASLYALCMAGFLAAVTQAPMTSFVIVMEMIDGHEMVLSLIAVTLLASLVSRLLSPGLYHGLATAMLEKYAPPDQDDDAVRKEDPH